MRAKRSTQFTIRRNGLLLAVIGLLPLVAGCPTEVPYAEADPPETAEEAPSFEEAAAEEVPSPSAAESTPPPETPDPEVAETAEPVAPPAEPATGQLPWNTDDSADAPEMFADVSEDTPAKDNPPAADEPDGFADFLDQAYGNVTSKEPADQPEPEAAPPAEEEVAAAAPAMEDLWGAATEAADEETPEPETPEAIAPKQPTTTEPTDADLLDELWGDTPADPEPATEPPVEPEATLPFGEPSADGPEPLFETPPPADEPAFDEPPPALEEEPADEPPPVTPEPLPEPPRAARSAGGPLASSAIKPLPAVPVLPFNTRHLAWLLGGKLGLAELADLDGATPTEVAEWRAEVRRLADELKIADPSSAGPPSSDPAERVRLMMDAAARAGQQLRKTHGVDHAALLEIALKTNALLVVADKRPDLAGPVGEAVREAAGRAMLPRFLWEDPVRQLTTEPSAEEAHDAVVHLHERVESFLR